MWEPEKWLQDNYRGLAAGMGREVHELADRFADLDPKLAAWMRSQAPAPQAEPKQRRAPKRVDG